MNLRTGLCAWLHWGWRERQGCLDYGSWGLGPGQWADRWPGGRGRAQNQDMVLPSAGYLLMLTLWISGAQVSPEICSDRRASRACPSAQKLNLSLWSPSWPLCPEIRSPRAQPRKAPRPPASLDLIQGVKPRALAPSSPVFLALENSLEPHCQAILEPPCLTAPFPFL